MRLILCLLSLFLITSCATSKSMIGPNGEIVHMLNCSGTALTWSNCYEKASQICGTSGYLIYGSAGDTSTMMTANQFGAVATPIITREMMIQCKDTIVEIAPTE